MNKNSAQTIDQQNRIYEVAVVIPAYNAALTIGRTIESVLNQTVAAKEIIVVNDGSKDDTAKVVGSFGPKVTLINQENGGVSAARNHGTRKANAEWIAYLDSDDMWLPEKLERQISHLKSNSHLQWSATRYFQCVGDRKILSNYSQPVPEDPAAGGCVMHALKAISSFSNIWVSTVLIRKTLVLEAGGFHEKLSSTADNDLWFRVGKIEKDVAFVNQPLALYMVDPAGMSRSETKRISPARYEFFERLAGHINDSAPTDRPLFEKIFDRYAGQFMFNLARTGNHEASRSLLQWLNDNNLRTPGLKYRWIHWLPTKLLDWLRKVRKASTRS